VPVQDEYDELDIYRSSVVESYDGEMSMHLERRWGDKPIQWHMCT
jgi:hypothetical protein